MSIVNVVAIITAKKEHQAEVKTLLTNVVPLSRKDPGCLSYDLHEDLGHPEVFVFYETWESREMLEAHLKTPHLVDLLAKGHELFAGAEVRILKKLSD